ncbi:hypothetical protein PM082_008774 [Marasmius tenuissimus]|nr:hypothetical protein PM082_008774 [Marasmius tenuissimus]
MASGTELKRLEQTLKWTFADKSRLQGFLAKKERPAQRWLDRMQQLIDYPDLSPESRPAIFIAMLRLSKNSGLHPTCLSIQNVKKIGEYPIAAGGFGDVWKGTIGDSSELVCLKVVKVYLKSDLVKLTSEYLREAIVWRQLKHPNVLPFFGIYRLEHTQQLCLISPWMEKGNLVEFLKATKREDVDHYTLVYDVTSGLAYLHSRKIVHGDLKGLNILITCSFRASIADFGLSRITDTNGLRITTSTTRPVGTTRWLAPELLVGSGGPSKESDMYSYACVCYEIFTGLQPFPELANEMTVAFNVAQGKRPSRPEGAPELSDVMWGLMSVCWDANPSSRPSASHVLEKVKRIAVRVLPASDWSESLFTQVWENVEHRSLSPGSPNGSQLGVNRIFPDLLEATPSPWMHERTTLDPVPDSLPFSSVDAPATFSEVETRLDDDSGPSSYRAKDVLSHPDHSKNTHEAHSQIQSNGSLPTPLETDVEPPEVLSSPTQQAPSYAKPTVPSLEGPNTSVKDELHPVVGTIKTALPQSLQVVIKDFWNSNWPQLDTSAVGAPLRITECQRNAQSTGNESGDPAKHLAYQEACTRVVRAHFTKLEVLARTTGDDQELSLIFDDLANSSLLQHCRPDTELISLCNTFLESAHGCSRMRVLANAEPIKARLYDWIETFPESFAQEAVALEVQISTLL